MKEGLRRYRVQIQALGEGLDVGIPARSRAEALAAEFARKLEAVVRRYPHQWFNFYDFWK